MTFSPGRHNVGLLGLAGHRSDMFSFLGGCMTWFNGTSETNQSWPTNNLSLAIPFDVHVAVTVTRLYVVNGSAPASSFDVGIYTSDGATLKCSTGAQTASGQLQTVDVTDTLLVPGGYLLAMAAPLTTYIATRSSVTTSTFLDAMGCKQMATNYVLGSTFTAATYGQNFIPNCGIIAYQAAP